MAAPYPIKLTAFRKPNTLFLPFIKVDGPGQQDAGGSVVRVVKIAASQASTW